MILLFIFTGRLLEKSIYMFYRIRLLAFIIFYTLAFLFNVSAQQMPAQGEVIGDPKIAGDYFKTGDFKDALKEYLVLLKEEPENSRYKLNIAICYINTNIDKSKALPYLEYLISQKAVDPITYFYLGRAYHLNYKFDEAIEAFDKFKELAPNETANIKQADRFIEMCNNGKELMKFPLNVTFKNVGKDVNSEGPDYAPFVPEDESFMVFSTRRKGVTGEIIDVDGFHTSDVFISQEKGGKWAKAKSIGYAVNTEYDEQVVGLTSDGRNLLVFINNGYDILGDLYMSSTSKGKNFQKAVPLHGLNSDKYEWADREEVYFASEGLNANGGIDLFMSRKLPNGIWGTPINLGKNINTEFDDNYPIISADGKTLYFCSHGHTTMGGYDVFKSQWDENKQEWSTVKNLGHPFSSWLYKIARNQIADYYRARRETASIDNIDPEYFAAPASVHLDLSMKMEFEHVRNAIQKLKPEYQDVIIMRFIDDLPHEEVASVIGKSVGATKLIQHRAIKKLQQILKYD